MTDDRAREEAAENFLRGTVTCKVPYSDNGGLAIDHDNAFCGCDLKMCFKKAWDARGARDAERVKILGEALEHISTAVICCDDYPADETTARHYEDIAKEALSAFNKKEGG